MSQYGNRIGVFSHAYAPFEGGAEIAARSIIARLKDFQFAVFTMRFNSDWAANERFANGEIIRVGQGKSGRDYYGRWLDKFFYLFKAFFAAEREHRKNPFRATWAIMASYGGIAALIFKLRHPGVPLLLTLQEGDSEEYIMERVGSLYPIWRLLFRRADAIQVISKYLKDFAVRHGARCPVEVVPNGVAIDKTKNQTPKTKDTNQKTKVIITTSRLVHKNGVDILIRAAAELKKIRPPTSDFRLLIVGGGPLEKELKQLVKEIGVDDVVEFIGQVPFHEIPGYLQKAHIFVRASRSEGLGTAFLEAMACGLPIIGTAVGGIQDFLKDGETGLIAKVNDSVDTADKINFLLKDHKLYARFRERGLQLVAERYSWGTVSSQMDVIFKRLAGPRLVVATGIFPPDIGGSATWTKTVLDGLGCKYQIRAVAYGDRIEDSRVSSVSRNLPKGIRHMAFLLRLIERARKADCIIAADSSFGAAFVGALASRIARKKFLLRVTGDYAWEQGEQRFGVQDSMDEFQKRRYGFPIELLRWFGRYAARTALGVIAPSKYLKDIVVGWGMPASKISVVYNAVELPELSISQREARRRVRLEGRVAVSAGRLVPWKGFEKLLTIAVQIKKDIPDFKLVIAGEGPERSVLETKVARLGLADTVFFTGRISKELLITYMRAADIFVLNTDYEGLSHQIIEALSLNMPVVTTDAGGNPEVKKLLDSSRREKLILVKAGDAPAFEKAMRKALSGSKTDTHSNNQPLAHFNKDSMISGLEQVIQSI